MNGERNLFGSNVKCPSADGSKDRPKKRTGQRKSKGGKEGKKKKTRSKDGKEKKKRKTRSKRPKKIRKKKKSKRRKPKKSTTTRAKKKKKKPKVQDGQNVSYNCQLGCCYCSKIGQKLMHYPVYSVHKAGLHNFHTENGGKFDFSMKSERVSLPNFPAHTQKPAIARRRKIIASLLYEHPVNITVPWSFQEKHHQILPHFGHQARQTGSAALARQTVHEELVNVRGVHHKRQAHTDGLPLPLRGTCGVGLPQIYHKNWQFSFFFKVNEGTKRGKLVDAKDVAVYHGHIKASKMKMIGKKISLSLSLSLSSNSLSIP